MTIMKSIAAIALAAAAAVAIGGWDQNARTLDPNATEWEGWVRFTGEEFELYSRRVDVLRPFSRPCLSGALPRDEQRMAARDLSGAKVRVTGRTTAWSRDLPGDRIDREGSNITNSCGGAVVILADSVEPI